MQQLKEFFDQGGFFMYVNLLCSVVVVTLIVDRTMFFSGQGSGECAGVFGTTAQAVVGGAV